MLQGLGDQPEIPWKCEEHVGSHIAEDCRDASREGKSAGTVMFGGLLACYIHGARVRACDNALTFQQNYWLHCDSI